MGLAEIGLTIQTQCRNYYNEKLKALVKALIQNCLKNPSKAKNS
jgi:hypothetical protein